MAILEIDTIMGILDVAIGGSTYLQNAHSCVANVVALAINFYTITLTNILQHLLFVNPALVTELAYNNNQNSSNLKNKKNEKSVNNSCMHYFILLIGRRIYLQINDNPRKRLHLYGGYYPEYHTDWSTNIFNNCPVCIIVSLGVYPAYLHSVRIAATNVYSTTTGITFNRILGGVILSTILPRTRCDVVALCIPCQLGHPLPISHQRDFHQTMYMQLGCTVLKYG